MIPFSPFPPHRPIHLVMLTLSGIVLLSRNKVISSLTPCSKSANGRTSRSASSFLTSISKLSLDDFMGVFVSEGRHSTSNVLDI